MVFLSFANWLIRLLPTLQQSSSAAFYRQPCVAVLGREGVLKDDSLLSWYTTSKRKLNLISMVSGTS